MDVSTLNSLSSYTLYNFIETQGTSGATACVSLYLEFGNLDVSHLHTHTQRVKCLLLFSTALSNIIKVSWATEEPAASFISNIYSKTPFQAAELSTL